MPAPSPSQDLQVSVFDYASMEPVMREPRLQSRRPPMPLSFAIGGAGLKHQHAHDILAREHAVDFFEIHAENYMGAGGPPHALLQKIRTDYPLSIHGVGLS